MGRTTAKLDYRQFEKMQKQLEQAGNKQSVDEFCRRCAKELAARLLAKVIRRTPVGQYPEGSGKTGGTLRRGWTAGKQSSAAVYAQNLPIHKEGTNYVIEIVNPVEYASYVEFGHRTVNHKGWVPGQFMLTISEDELRNEAPAIIERKLEKYLLECFK